MKAVRYSQFGGPEVLKIVDLPDPHAGPGQIRVAVHAAGREREWPMHDKRRRSKTCRTPRSRLNRKALAASWRANPEP
jgi:hypothetical protein